MARYLVCYDVPHNRRRARISRILNTYGESVQKSVYELPVSRALMEGCIEHVSNEVDEATDRVAVYRMCEACDDQRAYLGPDQPRIGEEGVFVV